MTAEHNRLQADPKTWKNWGPYLSERQWGTVREDYSATGDKDIAIRVDPPQITGAQKDLLMEQVCVLVCLGVGRALKDAGVIDTDFANLVHATFAQAVGCFHQHFDVRIGQRKANRAYLLFTIRWVGGHTACRFRQPVSFADGQPRRTLKFLEKLDLQRGRAAERHFQRRDIGIHRALHERGKGRRHADQEGDLVTLAQLPEVIEHAITTITRRRREDDMRTRRHRAAHDNYSGKDVKQWQRTHRNRGFIQQNAVHDPCVVDDAACGVLRDLWHASGAAGVKVGDDAVFLRILKLQRLGLGRNGADKIMNLGVVADWVFRPDQRDDEFLQPREVAVQIDLDHVFDVGRQRDSSGGLLRHVRLGERFKGHENFGVRLTQDRGDLIHIE